MASYLEEHCKLILQEKEILLKEGETLKLTVTDLRAKMGDQASNSSQVEEMLMERRRLADRVTEQTSENAELQVKLRRLLEEQELEINKVHLVQLRNSGGDSLNQEVTHLNAELTATRASLTQALESRDKLAGEREKP